MLRSLVTLVLLLLELDAQKRLGSGPWVGEWTLGRDDPDVGSPVKPRRHSLPLAEPGHRDGEPAILGCRRLVAEVELAAIEITVA